MLSDLTRLSHPHDHSLRGLLLIAPRSNGVLSDPSVMMEESICEHRLADPELCSSLGYESRYHH